MKILVPVPDAEVIIDAVGGAAVSDYPVWSGTTAYAVGARVYRASADNLRHYDYEAIVAHTNSDPRVNFEAASPNWVRLGVSNRYKLFDRAIGEPVRSTGGVLSYRFALTRNVTSVAFFGLVGQNISLSILSENGSGGFTTVEGSNRSALIADSPGVSDWFQYFFAEFDLTPDMLFDDLPGYAGNYLNIQVTGESLVEIGEIVFGTEMDIGTTLERPTISIQDFSRKERDEFGRVTIVERPFSLRGEFDIIYPTSRTRSLLTQLTKIRATPCVFYVDGMDTGNGTMIFGYYTDFSVNLEVGSESYSSITVEGLI